MIPTSESTGIYNFDQLRHHRCTLSAPGARLHIASYKVSTFDLPKNRDSVPKQNLRYLTKIIIEL